MIPGMKPFLLQELHFLSRQYAMKRSFRCHTEVGVWLVADITGIALSYIPYDSVRISGADLPGQDSVAGRECQRQRYEGD